jgi:hypothetical protein
MARVMDLPGWPPQSGGAYKPGEVFPISTDEVTVERFLLITEGHVAFICRFNGRSFAYDFFVADEKIAGKFVNIINDSHGKKLFDVVLTEIPPDES